MNKINLIQPLVPGKDKLIDRFNCVIKSKWLTNFGPQHNEFENKLKQYLNIDNLFLTCNGTIALMMSYKFLKLKGNVITTPFTFTATTNALNYIGLDMKFCDIDDGFNIDVGKIESLIDENTSAIVPVHVFGNPCQTEEIQRIADKYNLKVIYDSAHAFGVKYKKQSILKYGDMSVFSMHSTKIFSSVEGGCIVVNNGDSLSLRKQVNFGFNIANDNVNIESIEFDGINGKMSEFHAAFGIEVLDMVQDEINKRHKIYDMYCERLKNIKEITVGVKDIDKDVEWNYIYYSILVDQDVRNKLSDWMIQNNVVVKKYFYPLCSDALYLKDKPKYNLPNAKRISESILCLPMYGDLTEEQIDYICNKLKEFFNK